MAFLRLIAWRYLLAHGTHVTKLTGTILNRAAGPQGVGLDARSKVVHCRGLFRGRKPVCQMTVCYRLSTKRPLNERPFVVLACRNHGAAEFQKSKLTFRNIAFSVLSLLQTHPCYVYWNQLKKMTPAGCMQLRNHYPG